MLQSMGLQRVGHDLVTKYHHTRDNPTGKAIILEKMLARSLGC